jgi:hypothetical protein
MKAIGVNRPYLFSQSAVTFRCAAFCFARHRKHDRSPLSELARLLVRLDHVARFIANARPAVGFSDWLGPFDPAH